MKKNILKNEKGSAMIEAVSLVVVFIMLLSFGLGFYGAVHTAILNSISARAYAFETFRGRTNLNFFREDGSALTNPLYLGNKAFRFHAIQSEGDARQVFVATSRPIDFSRQLADTQASVDVHNTEIYSLQARNQKTDINPIWVMVGYGICLNSGCGD